MISAVEALVSGFALGSGEHCSSVMGPFADSLLQSAVVTRSNDAPLVEAGPELSIRIDQFHRTFGAISLERPPEHSLSLSARLACRPFESLRRLSGGENSQAGRCSPTRTTLSTPSAKAVRLSG